MIQQARIRAGVVALAIALSAPLASAQQASGIAGVVKDTSGGVLPGVSVEASSPALIEKTRTVISDNDGRYNIVGLVPGTYAVSFTLPGFSTQVRDGIELTAGFTAAVNADLQVGTLEDTITVSGVSPLVDTQNVRKQTVVSAELLDVLPTSTKSQNLVITLTPGLTGMSDVSGSYSVQLGGSFHGKSGTKVQVDGMSIQNMQSNGATGYQLNAGTVAEIAVQTSGISAESTADGIVVNVIPKEGGNLFSGSLLGMYTNDSLGSSNLTDDLRQRGLSTTSEILEVYDYQFTLGGPVRKDGCGSSPRCGSGATACRMPAPSTTRRRERPFTRRILTGRRSASSGGSPARCGSPGRRRRATSSPDSGICRTRATAARRPAWGSRRKRSPISISALSISTRPPGTPP